MDAMVRVLACVNRVRVADPVACCSYLEELLETQPKSDITVFPSLALTGACGEKLFKNNALRRQLDRAMQRMHEIAAQRQGYLIVGTVIGEGAFATPATAVFCDGELLGYVANNSSAVYNEQLLPQNTLFGCGNITFSITSGETATLLSDLVTAAQTGCQLLINTAYSPVRVGENALMEQTVRLVSKQQGVAVISVNGGIGDSSHPHLYNGSAFVCECGHMLAMQAGSHQSFALCCDLDSELLCAQCKTNAVVLPMWKTAPCEKKSMLRLVARCPYIREEAASDYLDELFSYQAQSLATRLENTKMTHAVIGVSGGLDSTLALLVAAHAFDRLEIPRKNLVCITMPGFGTSDRTYYNALGLMNALGVTMRDIPIRAAVTQHFEDIGHDPAVRDVTYENAQARERTQILLDVANTLSAVVIGTGDLSEEALGWCTFGGDALAGYNVNVCVPKTVIRMLTERLAETELLAGTREYLLDILSTPVSPELLPADEKGEIAQKTEDILGPYELHDFFLYYLVKYGFSPKRIFLYAVSAFNGLYPPEEIKRCLALFLKRFYTAQFKRSCAPDSAAITEITLNGIDFFIPSDLSPKALLEELEELP